MLRTLLALASLVVSLTTSSLASELDVAPVPSGRLVVFINGINATPEGTFTNQTTQAFWPTLMRSDPRFDRADILVYPIESNFGPESPRITDLADKLALDLEEVVRAHSSVLIVAHSLGGVVARKYLLDQSRLEHGGVLADNRVKGLLFLGVPMDGSALANLGSEIFESTTLWQLGAKSDPDSFLDTLRTEWIAQKLALSVPTECAYETIGVPIPWWFWRGPIVVTADSASLLCNTGVTGLAGLDHWEIVRPAEIGSQAHRIAASFYQEMFGDPVDERAPAEVLMANCEVNRYGQRVFDAFAAKLYDMSVTIRVSPTLPRDWDSTPISAAWSGTDPRVVVIHYSCFQDRESADADVLEERRIDFNEFLAALAPTNVKVLAYSRAFTNYPKFLEENITVANRKAFADGRLLLLPLPFGVPIDEPEVVRFGEKVNEALTP